jgi:hypothetical protein
VDNQTNCYCACHVAANDPQALIAEYPDVMSADFVGWYASIIRKIGVKRFMQIADQARAGNDPRRLFSYLLRQHDNAKL